MKTGLLIILASVGLLVSVPHVFASESFHGKSSFENLSSELIPGKPTQFEIKFQYTSEPYALDNLISIIDVNPASAKSYVQIDVKPIDVTQGQIVRIPVGITVDPQIEHKQIFLSVSFAGEHFSSRSDATYKSAWSDSVIIDIEKNLVPEPEQDEPISENCEPGTTLQDGMCVVDETKENSIDTSVRWGGPAYNVESPLKQFNSGVPADEIQCRDSLILVTKNDGSPACVKEQTILKLVERGLIIASKAERDLMLAAGYKLYSGVGWVQEGQEKPLSPEPEPEPTSTAHQNLIDARNKLRDAYHANTSFGPFNIKDAVVGYGISDGFLVVDILEEYYNSEKHYPLITQKIIDITGGEVDIGFISSDAVAPTSIESVFPHIWNGFLHRNGIEFTPKYQSYANNDIGYDGVHRVCSPVITSNDTEIYISSIFVYEPFEITGTYIDKTKPDDCYKIWKTDVVLEEPDRILMLWLENYYGEKKK